MMPVSLILPAAVPPGFLGTLIDVSSIMPLIASLAVSGVAGVALALVDARRATRRRCASLQQPTFKAAA